MAVIVGVVVVPFFVWNPHTFFANCLAFPLGLSGVNSPAASPLPGHLLTSLVPSAHRVLLVGLVVVGTPFLVWWLRRRPPRDVADVCRLTAVVAIVVMCVAPATRVGYVVYPVNLLLWSWLLTPVAPNAEGTDVEVPLGVEPLDATAQVAPVLDPRRASAEVGDLEQPQRERRRRRGRRGRDDAGLPVERVAPALLEEDLVAAARGHARRDHGPPECDEVGAVEAEQP